MQYAPNGTPPAEQVTMTNPIYFVAVNGKALWVATMPYGTSDLAFARSVAASIPGSTVQVSK